MPEAAPASGPHRPVTDRDLLGDPVAATPAMDAPLPWLIFLVSESEWFVARTLDEAKRAAAREWGWAEWTLEDPEMFQDAGELPDSALDVLQYVDGESPPRSFRAELARRIAAGLAAPEPFATENY